MSICVPTPVSTAFSTVTGNTITTTYSLSTSTAPPVVTTHVNPYCQDEAVVLDSTVCLNTGTRTSTETLQPALDVIYTIPYETTITVTNQVPFSTIYGGCPNTPSGTNGNGGNNPNNGGGSGNGSNPGSNNSGSESNSGNNNGDGNSNSGNNGAISVPPGHTLVTSSVLVYTTGQPETSTIPSLITLPNGQVTTTSVVTVVTPKPSQVYVPTTALVEQTGMSGPGSGGGNLGVIIGAVIAGFIGLCLMILALWYVRRKRKMAYDEILHGHEKQIDDREARLQAIERSRDPTRKRESDPKPTPYHYGSLLSGGSRIQSSTSTGVTLSQNPFEGAGVGNRATYLAPVSPLLTTVPMMEEFGIGSGLGLAAEVGVGASGVGGHNATRDSVNPSAPSILSTSETVPTMNSTSTLESSSGRSSDLRFLRPHNPADEFVEVDIGGVGTGVVGGSRMISPPPHLSMSFGSWNSDTSQGRRSGISKRSSGTDPGKDPGPGSSDGGYGCGEDEGQRRLLPPQQQGDQHQRYTMESHTTAISVQVEAEREEIKCHLRKRSGSPVSWATPARGTLFIVNQRDSEDI